MQNPTFSLISGGLYCNSNVSSETITYAANLCGNMWQLGEGFLVPLKCAVVIYTGMPKKTLATTLLILEEYIFIL